MSTLSIICFDISIWIDRSPDLYYKFPHDLGWPPLFSPWGDEVGNHPTMKAKVSVAEQQQDVAIINTAPPSCTDPVRGWLILKCGLLFKWWTITIYNPWNILNYGFPYGMTIPDRMYQVFLPSCIVINKFWLLSLGMPGEICRRVCCHPASPRRKQLVSFLNYSPSNVVHSWVRQRHTRGGSTK